MTQSIFRTSLLSFVFTAVALCAQSARGQRAHSGDGNSDILFEMMPGSSEEWSLLFLNGQTPRFSLFAEGPGIAAKDTVNTLPSWYFVSPASFSGDLKAAYNGKLSFNIVHAYVPDWESKRNKDVKEPVVILQAKCGHYLYWASPNVGTGTTVVMLHEDDGWKDSRTGKAAGVMDMLGVLSHLSHIKIRGGYFKKTAEVTRLSSVQVTGGSRSWYPCCTLQNEIDMCRKKPTEWFSPSNLNFYCEGSLKKTIKVTRVYPRFARRSGGASITVTGQNFGLSGSQPIVRIGGRQCETTRFVASSQTDTGREALTNKDGNAMLTAWDSATDSMKSMYPEHCWNGMKDDGSSTGFNYGTAAVPKYINQGETGIDTGGPCFPSHCSSCPDNNKAWCTTNQIVAVASGVCKGRGNEDVACAATFPYQHYPNMCPDNAEQALSATIVSSVTAATLTSATSRGNTPTLTSSQTVFDLMDVKYTTIPGTLTAAATSITVSAATNLVCQNHNDAAARDCSAAGAAADIVENYVKIMNLKTGTKEPDEGAYEVVKVTAVNGNVLTAMRAQGSTLATSFAADALVMMCGKHVECLVSWDLKNDRFIKVNNEVMGVTGVGAIAHVSLSANPCGGGLAASSTTIALGVTCTAPCVSSRSLAGTVATDGAGKITSVTITDHGSGYNPEHLPAIAVTGDTGSCVFTAHWSSLTVSRAAALTTAATHGAKPVVVTRMGCINDDETGDNCGGTCKPCPSTVMGPEQQDTLVCTVPEAVRGVATRDLAVTVEATSGPAHSPYGVQMKAGLKGWEDASVAGVSCISEQSRGFAYGAHDFEWASSLRGPAGGGSVQTTSLAVDTNSGEIYVTGTTQKGLTIKGKHIMTGLQMGELTVTPTTTATVTCTGAANGEHWVSGVGNKDCGRISFIARFSKDGKALYLNKLEHSGTTPALYQTVITDASFDSSSSHLYVTGYFNDGDSTSMEKPTLKAYDIDPTTRVSKSTASGSLEGATLDNTNKVYQEGFLLKYTREGALVWMRSIKSNRLPTNSGLIVSRLRVAVYKASTSSIINTATAGQATAATEPTHSSRRDMEYDNGVATGGVQGGTGADSTITLKADASSTDHWYNGLSIRITRGAGYGQKRRIFEYAGASKIAKVMPAWDPHDTPGSGSRYVIEGGRPSSSVDGTHWTNGGVYVTARVETVCGTDCFTSNVKTSTSVRIGEMNAVYRNSDAKATAKYVDVSLAQNDHQNFVSQFDDKGKVYWARCGGYRLVGVVGGWAECLC